MIVRSMAMNGRTDEQLLMPVNCTKRYIAPRILNRSCSPFLGEENIHHITSGARRRQFWGCIEFERLMYRGLHVLPLLPEERSKYEGRCGDKQEPNQIVLGTSPVREVLLP